MGHDAGQVIYRQRIWVVYEQIIFTLKPKASYFYNYRLPPIDYPISQRRPCFHISPNPPQPSAPFPSEIHLQAHIGARTTSANLYMAILLPAKFENIFICHNLV